MHKFDLSKFSFWLLLSGVSLALILVIAVSMTSPAPSADENGTEVPASLSREVVKARYDKAIKELVSDYSGKIGDLDKLTVRSPYLGLTSEIKVTALELAVPEEAKSMHLDFVIALNFLEKGFGGSAEDLDEGRGMFKQLLEENQWLAE
ncbi:MAG: hypothetical protein PHW53_00395 [Patescibacteria group bacterium]|nr:hypothetical protein [Patescibacteria group bacterium]